MFLERVRTLSREWNANPELIVPFAKESLLYGMRLTARPTALKRELKRMGQDKDIAKSLWFGNFYLLLTLPKVLVSRKQKIPCLEDLLFVRETLNLDQKNRIENRVRNLSPLDQEKLILKLLPSVRQYAYKGTFLQWFDPMYNKLEDVRQDLAVEAIALVNREMMNFSNQDEGKVHAYLSFCLKGKSKSYVAQKAPKTFRTYYEPEVFDKIVHARRTREQAPEAKEFLSDLKNLLNPSQMKAVRLLLQSSSDEEQAEFDDFLVGQQLNPKNVTDNHRKKLIELYLGEKVFSQMKSDPALVKYLGVKKQQPSRSFQTKRPQRVQSDHQAEDLRTAYGSARPAL